MVRFICVLLTLVLPFKTLCQNDSTEWIVTFFGTPPFFEGCLVTFIQEQIIYPESAKKDSLEGMVVISYWVDTCGSTIGHEIVRSLRKDLDEEAIRVTRLIKYKSPAFIKGKPVRIKEIVPVKFNLHDNQSEKEIQKQGSAAGTSPLIFPIPPRQPPFARGYPIETKLDCRLLIKGIPDLGHWYRLGQVMPPSEFSSNFTKL